MNEAAAARLFVGSWSLSSCEHRRRDGVVEFPFGRTPLGRLVYSADGRMIVLITDPSRPSARSPQFFEAAPTELAAAARGCVAYSGSWEIRGAEVVHHLEQSLFPNWTGGSLARTFRITRGRLTLSTAPFLIGGDEYTAVLVWKRLSSRRRRP